MSGKGATTDLGQLKRLVPSVDRKHVPLPLLRRSVGLLPALGTPDNELTALDLLENLAERAVDDLLDPVVAGEVGREDDREHLVLGDRGRDRRQKLGEAGLGGLEEVVACVVDHEAHKRKLREIVEDELA